MDVLLNPLYDAVSWVLLRFHDLFSLDLRPRRAGRPGALSIVGSGRRHPRILLIPLFVKQIKASAACRLIQPQMQGDPEEVQGRPAEAVRRRR